MHHRNIYHRLKRVLTEVRCNACRGGGRRSHHHNNNKSILPKDLCYFCRGSGFNFADGTASFDRLLSHLMVVIK